MMNLSTRFGAVCENHMLPALLCLCVCYNAHSMTIGEAPKSYTRVTPFKSSPKIMTTRFLPSSTYFSRVNVFPMVIWWTTRNNVLIRKENKRGEW